MIASPTRPPTVNFKAQALTEQELRSRAPSIFSPGPMAGLSTRYTFVPTSEVVGALGERGWVPVGVQQQRVRLEARWGFQKHLVRFCRVEQLGTLDEWNLELVLINSHDALSSYVLRVGIFRRICTNGLIVSSRSFEAIRFRHAGLQTREVVTASERITESLPRVAARIEAFRNRFLTDSEARRFAAEALALRYGQVDHAPVEPETLLRVRRPEDTATDLWTTYNKVQENLIRGGLSDSRRGHCGRLRTLRALRGIDSRISLNMNLWSLAERIVAERN